MKIPVPVSRDSTVSMLFTYLFVGIVAGGYYFLGTLHAPLLELVLAGIYCGWVLYYLLDSIRLDGRIEELKFSIKEYDRYFGEIRRLLEDEDVDVSGMQDALPNQNLRPRV